jgi:hypothetical protein
VASPCSSDPPVGSGWSDVIEPEESAAEDALALSVLPVQPPRQHHEQRAEHRLQEVDVGGATLLPVELIDLPDRPGNHRRVHGVEVPFERWDRPVGMLRSWRGEQHHLTLRKCWIDRCHDHSLKCQVPRGIPRIFPLVGHEDDVSVVKMQGPVTIAAPPPLSRRGWLRRIAN